MFNFRCPSLPMKIKHGRKLNTGENLAMLLANGTCTGLELHVEPTWRMSMDEICAFVANVYEAI